MYPGGLQPSVKAGDLPYLGWRAGPVSRNISGVAKPLKTKIHHQSHDQIQLCSVATICGCEKTRSAGITSAACWRGTLCGM